jgi:hypothetical protein
MALAPDPSVAAYLVSIPTNPVALLVSISRTRACNGLFASVDLPRRAASSDYEVSSSSLVPMVNQPFEIEKENYGLILIENIPSEPTKE